MITTKNLSFAYPGKSPVFRNLSLTFKNEFNVIIGPNAAGKSTFLKCLFHLLSPSGRFFYGNRDITNITLKERIALMAYLPQEEISSLNLTVFETVLLGRLPYLNWHITKEDASCVMKILETLHISHLAQTSFSSLSGGQQKLVSIAQTLVRKPKVLLMDEPTNSLDLQKQLELCEIIKEITRHHI